MRLGVNIDHVATVRQARGARFPDPVEAALTAERAGATSIVCHLREDRRHIQDRDVRQLRRRVRTRLNLEMSIAPDVVATALRVRPHQATLVPERRQELTTEGGLDVVRLRVRLAQVIAVMADRGIETSLFVDPSPRQLRAACQLGVPVVELHTGAYANAGSAASRRKQLALLRKTARLGRALGLRVAAGHGLDYRNVQAVCRIREIEELNIGFAIIARALTVGLARAVSEMAGAIRRASAGA